MDLHQTFIRLVDYCHGIKGLSYWVERLEMGGSSCFEKCCNSILEIHILCSYWTCINFCFVLDFQIFKDCKLGQFHPFKILKLRDTSDFAKLRYTSWNRQETKRRTYKPYYFGTSSDRYGVNI